VALEGSSGYIEMALSGGSAEAAMGASIGDTVTVRAEEEAP